MTATVLIIGALHPDPVMRTAKTGKAFVTALLRSESQGETLWVNAGAFDEDAQAELMRLKGRRETICPRQAESCHLRASLDVVASHVLALRHPQKPPAARCIHGVVHRKAAPCSWRPRDRGAATSAMCVASRRARAAWGYS
jgi:hypothetical protein